MEIKISMKRQSAIVLTHDMLDTISAKTCHGLLRYTGRYEVKAVIDRKFVGRDAGEVMDGMHLNVNIYKSVSSYFENGGESVDSLIIGVATHGGLLPDDFVPDIKNAIKRGCNVVNGLHDYLSEHSEIKELADFEGVALTDIRKPKKINELHFWHGSIYDINASVLAVLGVDCALGKRTTCGMIYEMCNRKGLKTDMIYTGQTGWMQGYKHGFIFDSTLNDFISGEIEHAIVECDKIEKPELILLEGQSSLRNPSGPGGSEFLLSGNANGVILQVAPEREFFEGYEELKAFLPSAKEEIELIQHYGSDVIALTLFNQSLGPDVIEGHAKRLEDELGIPAVIPLKEGVDELYGVIDDYVKGRI